MTAVILEAHDISEYLADRSNRKRFAFLDGKRDWVGVVNDLAPYGMTGGRIIIATDGDVLAGCFAYNSVGPTNPCYSDEFLQELGDGARAVYRHNIWVRREYRGRGLAQQMFEAHVDDATLRGYTHTVGFMPQTEEIARWAYALPNNLAFMTARDRHGGKITCRRLV